MKKLVLTIVFGLFFVTFSNAQSSSIKDKETKEEVKTDNADVKSSKELFKADSKFDKKEGVKSDCKGKKEKDCKGDKKPKSCATKKKSCASKRPDASCKH